MLLIKNAMKGATWGRLNTRDLEQSYKAFDLWMTGLSNAIEKAGNTAVQTDETAESDVKTERYSLVTLKDGTVYVQADRQVFTSSNMDKRVIALEHALMDMIGDKGRIDIPVGSGEILSITDASQGYKNSVGKLTSFEEYYDEQRGAFDYEKVRLKQNAALHIDEVVRASFPKLRKGDYGFKHDEFAQHGWAYRDVFFRDYDGRYYRMAVSVADGQTRKTVYNIANFRQRNVPDALNGSSLSGAPLHGDNLSKSQISEPVKPEILSTPNTMLQKDETIQNSLVFPDADAALDILDGMDIDQLADLSADAFKDVKASGFFMLKDISRFLDKVSTDKDTRDKLTDLIENPHRRAMKNYADSMQRTNKHIVSMFMKHGIVTAKRVDKDGNAHGYRVDKAKSAAVQAYGGGYRQRPCKVEAEMISADTFHSICARAISRRGCVRGKGLTALRMICSRNGYRRFPPGFASVSALSICA